MIRKAQSAEHTCESAYQRVAVTAAQRGNLSRRQSQPPDGRTLRVRDEYLRTCAYKKNTKSIYFIRYRVPTIKAYTLLHNTICYYIPPVYVVLFAAKLFSTLTHMIYIKVVNLKFLTHPKSDAGGLRKRS